MPFDINALYANAKSVQSSSSQESTNYPYKTVFVKPNEGSSIAQLQVRLLPSVNSNPLAIATTYWTHKVNGTIHYCEYNYPGHDHCDLCQSIRNYKNATGSKERISEGAAGRSMMYVQYVASTGYVWSDKYPEPQVGEVIILMGPSGLYSKVNDLIVTQGPDGASKLVQDPVGYIVVVSRDKDNRPTITPTYGTITSANSVEEFDALLKSLPAIDTITVYGKTFEENHKGIVEASALFDRKLQVPAAQSIGVRSAESIAASNIGVIAQQVAPAPLPMPQLQPQQVVAPQPQVVTPQPVIPAPVQVVTPQPQVVQPQVVQPQVVQQVTPATPVAPITQVVQPQPISQQATPVADSVQVVTPITPVAPAQDLASGVPANANPSCTGVYTQGSPTCLICIAEPTCPFKVSR